MMTFNIGLFFQSFQRYVALCILISLIRGYWEANLTEIGFTVFKAWLVLCALVSGSGYVYLYASKIKLSKLNSTHYIMIGLLVVPTVLVFEYFRIV